MDIKGLVQSLCRQYDTRDPFDLARQRDIIVLFEPLGKIHGYYAQSHRQQVIHINQYLCAQRQWLTCAHELGHSVLHPDLNTPFLRAATFFSVDKLEIQANRFAVDLLYSDADLEECLSWTLEQTAAWMGVTATLAQYRIDSMPPLPTSDFLS